MFPPFPRRHRGRHRVSRQKARVILKRLRRGMRLARRLLEGYQGHNRMTLMQNLREIMAIIVSTSLWLLLLSDGIRRFLGADSERTEDTPSPRTPSPESEV